MYFIFVFIDLFYFFGSTNIYWNSLRYAPMFCIDLVKPEKLKPREARILIWIYGRTDFFLSVYRVHAHYFLFLVITNPYIKVTGCMSLCVAKDLASR